MELDTLLHTSDRRANRGLLWFMWIVSLVDSAASMGALVDSVSSDALAASRMATEGGQLVRQNQAAAEKVKALVEETAARLGELGGRSQKIGQVVDLIGEVAGGIENSLAAMAQTRTGVAESAGQSARTAQMLTGILEATSRTASQAMSAQLESKKQ